MNLKAWSLSVVLTVGFGWVLFVPIVALPYTLRWFAGRLTTEGGIVGITFGPREMLLVGIAALVPPLMLLAAWIRARRA